MAATTETTQGARASAAEAVRRRVLRSSKRFWDPKDFDASYSASQHALWKLAKEGHLMHIRRGVYWRGEKTLFGVTPPTSAELVRELVGETAVGPASWSAALALGLTTQHPNRDFIAIPRRPPTSLPRTVELKDRSSRQGRVREHLNWWEVALLEVLAEPRTIELDHGEAVKRLTQWLKTDGVRAKRLARAARDESALVRESLRGLLSAAGLSDEAALVPPAVSREVRQRALIAA